MTGRDALSPAHIGRLTRVSVALLVALGLAVVVSVLGAEGAGAPGGRLGGDLPAFFGAGRIAADGDWESLYDAEAQIAAQADLWDDDGDYLYFAYPPQVAAAYRILVPLGYRGAYLVHTMLMSAAVLGSLWLLRPVFDWLRSVPLVVSFAFALTFYPMLRAVLGGQNSALTLFLFAAVLRLEHDGFPFAAGLAGALLLYKPQFGIPLALLLAAGRRWRMLGGWTSGAAAGYVAGALALGPSWPADWWREATSFADLNAAVNGVNFASIPGFIEQVAGSGAGLIALGVVAAGGGLGAAVVWWTLPELPALRVAVATAVIVAAAPQALFYEAGVLLLPIGLLAGRRRTDRGRFLAMAWLAGLLQLGAAPLGASPLVLLVIGVAGLVLGSAAAQVRRRLPQV